MRLFHTSTSPFVRKVMLVLHETGLISQVETVFLRPQPWAPDAELSRSNPLAKIPVLTLDDGTTIYDSRVIVEYLDSIQKGDPLVPREGRERFRVLRTQALADGILEAAILVFYEREFRPKELHWEGWLDGQSTKVRQGLDALEQEASHFGERVDLGQIAAGAAIGWLAFRGVVGDPLAGRPHLARWYEAFATRPSMVATVPRA